MRRRDVAIAIGFTWITLLAVTGREAFAAPSPGITITATNVSVSGQGSGASNFTLTSVDGFSGQVGLTCLGPEPLQETLVLPDCTQPVVYYNVPANGTVTGTVPFTPPASITSSIRRAALSVSSDKTPRSAPLAAGLLAGIGLLGLRFRRKLASWSGVVVFAAAGFAGLAGLSGCVGPGGLVMTPGTYSYVIEAAPKGGGAGASTTIEVTVEGS